MKPIQLDSAHKALNEGKTVILTCVDKSAIFIEKTKDEEYQFSTASKTFDIKGAIDSVDALINNPYVKIRHICVN